MRVESIQLTRGGGWTFLPQSMPLRHGTCRASQRAALLARGIVINKKRIAPAARRALGWVVFVLAWPLPFALLFFDRSATMVANVETGLTALGVVALAGLYLRRSAISNLRFVGGFLVGALVASIGGWNLIGDFVLQRQFADGIVTKKSVEYGSRGRASHYIQIDGRRHPTTAEVYDRFQEGARIHAEIGVGSHTVLHATSL